MAERADGSDRRGVGEVGGSRTRGHLNQEGIEGDKIMIKFALALPLILLTPIVSGQEKDLFHPVLVDRCLEKDAVKGKIRVRTAANPYYLRGDFDGDGCPDYAVAIRGPKTRRNGVLICTCKDQAFILGADNPIKPPFSDVPGDSFVSSHWMVYTREETLTMTIAKKGETIPGSAIKGETIAMSFEDGTCFI